MLEREMAQVLLEMEMLASGSTTNYSPTGIGGVPDSRPPAGVRLDGGSTTPMHAYWRGKWEIAVERDEEAEIAEGGTVTVGRRNVITAAREALDDVRKPKEIVVNTETSEELAARIVEEADGWEIEQVVFHFNVTSTFVRKARLKEGRNPRTGKATEVAYAEMENRRERARQLAADGCSERQIVMLTGIKKTTLRRVLGRAA